MAKLYKRYARAAGGLAVVLGFCFIMLDPVSLPAAAYIAVFGLIYGFAACLVILSGLMAHRIGILPWSTSRIQKTGALVASFPVFLLLLQSIGQLTVRDVLIAAGLAVLLYLYLNRMSPQAN